MKKIVWFARRYMIPYSHWYLAGTLALFATNWISVRIPMYVARGIDALGQGEAGWSIILDSALIVAGLGVLVILVRTASRLLFFTPGRLVEAQVKKDLFSRLLELQPAFLSRWPTGDLISRCSSDVMMLRLLAGFALLGMVNTVTAFIMTGGQMLLISPRLAGWVMLPLLLGFAATMLFARQLFAIMRRMQKQAGELSDQVLSSYQGVATIQAFGAEASFRERFDTHNQAYLKSTLQRANVRTIMGPLLTITAAFNVFLLLYIGGPMVIRGELSVGELIAFTTLVAYLTGPLRGMSFIVSLLKQSQASLERIDEIILAEPDRPERKLDRPGELPTKPPALSIRELSYAYPDAPDAPVLTGINIEVPAGGTLGVLGLTGAGKTTLLRLLSRLYNPPPGTVFIDGVDVLDLDLDAWRASMTLVSQRPFLFSESVADNILLGAFVDDESTATLREAIDRSSLTIDIEALPLGTDTRVGESGVMLSGGQRQRVALARGLVREQHMLMLDDVLSAVDHTTEQELLKSLRHDGATRPTTVIVANRISALMHAEVIAVIDAGRLVDSGTHDELISRPGLYLDTWERQREGEEEVAS